MGKFQPRVNNVADIDEHTGTALPSIGLIRLTHFIYALHAFTVVTGLVTPAYVAMAFLTGWPSIIAVILNYLKRSAVRGTFLESHFRWQIRTFWFALLWAVIPVLLLISIIFIPFGYGLMVLLGCWVLYRVVRGWLTLAFARPPITI